MSKPRTLPIVDSDEARELYEEIMKLVVELECEGLHINAKPPYTVNVLRSILKVLQTIRDE